MNNIFLTNNKVERFKVSLIEWSLDNRKYESNHQNTNFDDLTFDGDERLIARKRLYCKNDNIAFGQINGLSVYIYTNWI